MHSWRCVSCSTCCRDYHVVLNFDEWVKIVRDYGVEATKAGLSKLFINKKSDGTCVFLKIFGDNCVCGLQHMKPKACKIWPFKVHLTPRYGNPNEARFSYRNQNFFVYVDPACAGLSWGEPTQEFKFRILPEFIDVAVGILEKQFYSTSKTLGQPKPYTFMGRRLF